MRHITLVTSVEIFDESVAMNVDLPEGLTIHEVWTRLARAGIRPSEITVGLGVNGELARVVLSEDRRFKTVDSYYRTKDRQAFAVDALGGHVRSAFSAAYA